MTTHGAENIARAPPKDISQVQSYPVVMAASTLVDLQHLNGKIYKTNDSSVRKIIKCGIKEGAKSFHSGGPMVKTHCELGIA